MTNRQYVPNLVVLFQRFLNYHIYDISHRAGTLASKLSPKNTRQAWTAPKSGFGAQRPLPSPAGPLLARSECGHGPHAHLWQPVRPSDTPAFAGGALPAKPLGERRRGVSSVERAPPNPSVTTWAMVVPSDPGRQASASAAPPGASYAGVASGRQRSFPPPQ